MTIKIAQELSTSKNILLSGAGGGFDVFCAIPLYFYLREQGKNIILTNLSFTHLEDTSAERVERVGFKVDHMTTGPSYFPESLLCKWLYSIGIEETIVAYEKNGAVPVRKVLQHLVNQHDIDTAVLIDGGTDSLMFGNESELGTPIEDMCSIAAFSLLKIGKKLLYNIGFGVDDFHGVSHYDYLENVSHLIQNNGFLDCYPLHIQSKEGQFYQSAVQYANQFFSQYKSIVNNSVLSAMQGHFGDYHATDRTTNSQLFINPIMSFAWWFELSKVVQKIKYMSAIQHSRNLSDLVKGIYNYRDSTNIKRRISIPL